MIRHKPEEKICKSSDKRFVSRIYKQFLQLNNKNINSTIDNSKKINWTDIPPTKIYEMQIST